MGVCGSTNNDDAKIGSTPDGASPSDVTVDVNDNDETVVYADTCRLVSTQMLRRLTAMVTSDSAFDQLAVMSTGKDVTGFHLVASEQWTAYYRAVWDIKNYDSLGDAKADNGAQRFTALLTAVESGAPYKKPGPSGASQSGNLQLLNTAVHAQTALLEGAGGHAKSDAEFAGQDEALTLWIKLFGVFDGGLKLMDNIDAVTAP